MLVNTVSSVVVGAKYVNGSKYDVILQLPGEIPKFEQSPERISAHGPPHQTIKRSISNTSIQHLFFITCPRNISNCLKRWMATLMPCGVRVAVRKATNCLPRPGMVRLGRGI